MVLTAGPLNLYLMHMLPKETSEMKKMSFNPFPGKAGTGH